MCSGPQNKYCNCPLPPVLVVSTPHLSSLYLPTPSHLYPVAKVRDPQDGTLSASGESQNYENNYVLGRGDPQVTGVPTSPLAALLPP